MPASLVKKNLGLSTPDLPIVAMEKFSVDRS